MADYNATVGNVELVSLTDGQGEMDPLQVFPASDMDKWREYPQLLDEGAHIHLRFASVAVRSSGKLIIVDTGLVGQTGTLMDEIQQKGVDPNAVDMVVITHLHPDHIGWNLKDGSPTFPNARYVISKIDWDYWTQPPVVDSADHVKEQALPLESLNVLDLIEGEYNLTDELTVLPTPGHTPGHISIAISSAGQKGFILGDVAHSPAQAHYTDWSVGFDVDGDVSRKTRHEIFDRLESEQALVSAGHFPDPGFGRFVREGGRRVWQGV